MKIELDGLPLAALSANYPCRLVFVKGL